MYDDNLPSIHCARPSVIGQRLIYIMAYINQLEGISNFNEMQGQYIGKGNIVEYY